jgi:hypothetical protein
MSWQRVSGAGREEVDLPAAAYHVLALFAPFLTGEARALIERLGEEYL